MLYQAINRQEASNKLRLTLEMDGGNTFLQNAELPPYSMVSYPERVLFIVTTVRASNPI
jgi:hypothetical protein